MPLHTECWCSPRWSPGKEQNLITGAAVRPGRRSGDGLKRERLEDAPGSPGFGAKAQTRTFSLHVKTCLIAEVLVYKVILQADLVSACNTTGGWGWCYLVRIRLRRRWCCIPRFASLGPLAPRSAARSAVQPCLGLDQPSACSAPRWTAQR